MQERLANFWFAVALVSVVAGGCQSAEDAAPDAVPVAAAPAGTSSEKIGAPTPEKQQTEGASDATAPTVMAQFTPPFPDRDELFEPPKRAQSTVRRDDESGDTVELKGFIHVDRPRVVLSIDGAIAPIAEGGEKYGVQVISIQPPNVVLQRGRSRWTATLD